MDVNKAVPAVGTNHWARGCGKCSFGMTVMPEHNTRLPLYLQRAVQASNGDIAFCDCRAGQAMRSYLRRAWADELKGRPDLAAMRDEVKAESAAPPMRYVGNIA